MNKGRDVYSSGSLSERSALIHKSLRTTLDGIHRPAELFPKIQRPSEQEQAEAMVEKCWTEIQRRRGSANPRPSPVAVEKSAEHADAAGLSVVEKALQQSGFDKLPMTDRAREMLESALSNGAVPVTQYTGRLMFERGILEVPPAALLVGTFQKETGGVLDRPTQDSPEKPGPPTLRVGDRVIPLQWFDTGLHGAKFDLPFVPGPARVKKIFMGLAVVTKEAFPPGLGPMSLDGLETVREERLWGMELEPENEAEKSKDHGRMPISARDTTMVLRLEPLALPTGEV